MLAIYTNKISERSAVISVFHIKAWGGPFIYICFLEASQYWLMANIGSREAIVTVFEVGSEHQYFRVNRSAPFTLGSTSGLELKGRF